MKYEDAVKKIGDRMYICDMCKETFPLSKVVLGEPLDDVMVFAPGSRYQYVNKDEEISGGLNPPSTEVGDKVLKCPVCGLIHPFGFQLDPAVIVNAGNALH